ncbi:MAG: hypothetical protein JWM76_242 [Pseudonocardiales bacterium]|nr:hypothetical protein [Pseudonocardiales bacterium]
MNRRITRNLAIGGAVVCAMGLLTACGGSKKQNTSATSSRSVSPSTGTAETSAPPTTTAPQPPAPVNPLTGVGAPNGLPVIAVKIDDTAPGRPQVNVDKADIVYIEQAEGGLSRLIGVFNTNHPVVGYVRSVRSSDSELLQQYGKITLVASGGGGESLPDLDRSGLNGWIQDRGSAYFTRDYRSRSSYINLTMDLAKVAADVKSPAAQSIGFTWSPGLESAVSVGVRTSIQSRVGQTDVTFSWDPALNEYVRYIAGVRQVAADGNPIATPNVIVMSCSVTPDPSDVDVNGAVSQFTNTVGQGAVTVFRNGVAIPGTWSRPTATSPTSLVDAAGHPIPLTPGGAWVALAANGAPLVAT